MSRLNPEKLSVEFRKGGTTTEPIIPRRYILAHNDMTEKLFLTIRFRYANDEINTMRDEVLREWVKPKDTYISHVCKYLSNVF